MENSLVLPAVLRLLDFASARRNNLTNEIKFNDEVGAKANEISSDIKKKYDIDIFSRELKIEDISKFEHLLGTVMSNFVRKKLVPRNLSDEVAILKNSKALNVLEFNKYKLHFSIALDDVLAAIKLNHNELLNIIKSSKIISHIPGEDLTGLYFTQTSITIEEQLYYVVSVLSHEKTYSDELSILAFFALNQKEYSQFDGNPTHLFLKGLDEYGVDLKINDTTTRYYSQVEVPVDTNIGTAEFLNMQNYDKSEIIVISLQMKVTLKSIQMKHVFAIRTKKIIELMNKIHAQEL